MNEVIENIPQSDEESEALKSGLNANRDKIMAILYKAEPEDIPSMLKYPSKIKNIIILENKSINELHPDELKKIIEEVNYELIENNVYKIPKNKSIINILVILEILNSFMKNYLKNQRHNLIYSQKNS